MKSCPTCGMAAEDRASFCPCCGSSFVVRCAEPTPAPAPVPVEPPKKTATKPTPPPPFFEKKERKGGHALPILIISVLTILAVGLSTLWVTGGLEAMVKKNTPPKTALIGEQKQSTAHPLPTIAATYDGGEITTQQYLAYLYLEFENVYYNQGLYMYENDVWNQTFPYGDSGENLLLSDFIIRATQDNIKRQIVLTKMMQDYGIQWIAEDEDEIEKTLSAMEEDAYIDLGFDNDSYAYALKNANLNERSIFYGLYKTGGAREVDEMDLWRYYGNNYVSYKMISIPLTNENDQALAEDSVEYEQIMAKISDYLTTYEQSGFDVVYVQHTGSSAENARVDVNADHMEEALAEAVRTVHIGEATIVEYMAGGTTPTIALIERLDPYEVYEQHIEDVIYELRYEAFNQEVSDSMAQLEITFDDTVIHQAKPEEILEILNTK